MWNFKIIIKMKKATILCVLFFIATITYAQSVDYKIIKNNPESLSERYLNLELLGADVAFDFNEAPVFVGVNGFYKINEKIKAEALLRLHLFNIVGSGVGLHMEGGVFTPLKKYYKNKDVKVIVGSTYGSISDKYGNNTRSGTTTNYLTAQGKYLNQLGVRGGVYLRNSVYYESLTSSEIDVNYTTMGVYLGAEKITQAFVEALVGKRSYYGQGRTKIYLDALILPVQSIENDVVSADDVIGYRAGMQWQQKPVKGNWFKPVYNAEIGSRPFTGFYIQVSIGISLFDF